MTKYSSAMVSPEQFNELYGALRARLMVEHITNGAPYSVPPAIDEAFTDGHLFFPTLRWITKMPCADTQIGYVTGTAHGGLSDCPGTFKRRVAQIGCHIYNAVSGAEAWIEHPSLLGGSTGEHLSAETKFFAGLNLHLWHGNGVWNGADDGSTSDCGFKGILRQIEEDAADNGEAIVVDLKGEPLTPLFVRNLHKQCVSDGFHLNTLFAPKGIWGNGVYRTEFAGQFGIRLADSFHEWHLHARVASSPLFATGYKEGTGILVGLENYPVGPYGGSTVMLRQLTPIVKQAESYVAFATPQILKMRALIIKNIKLDSLYS